MDTIMRTNSVRDRAIVGFLKLSAQVLEAFKDGKAYRLGVDKASPTFVYLELNAMGAFAPTRPRRCNSDELEMIKLALDMAPTFGYYLAPYAGPSGYGICHWEHGEPEVYDYPVAPTALLNGWITR